MNDDLHAHLREDAPESAPLLHTLRRLRQWPTPPADTARLLAVLQPALQTQIRARRRAALAWPWLLLRAQLRVVHREIWLGSALVIALGTLVAAAGSAAMPGALPLVLAAPLVTAVGAAYLFGPDDRSSLEVELAAPVPPRVILLARLTLLFAFDLSLGLLGSVLLSMVKAEVLLWPLVASWLAPMACLSAAAFLLSVLLVDATSAALASLGLWCLQALRQTGTGDLYLLFRFVPDLLRPGAQGGLWLAALVLVAAALWLGGQEERWIRRPS
jgi:hypothetical protein